MLVAAAPIDGSVRKADFWSQHTQHTQRFAWLALYAARLRAKSMRDVVLLTNVCHQTNKSKQPPTVCNRKTVPP